MKRKITFCSSNHHTIHYEMKLANSHQCIFASNDQFHSVTTHKSLVSLTDLYNQKGIFSHAKVN